MKLEELTGEILTHIDISADVEEGILLTTKSGRQIRIHHEQDCCESVMIETVEGQWHTILGTPLLEATHEECSEGDPPSRFADSWTRSVLTFRVNGATVITRWIGESNGYYSESVHISEIPKT